MSHECHATGVHVDPGIGPGYEWHRELTEDIAEEKEHMRYAL